MKKILGAKAKRVPDQPGLLLRRAVALGLECSAPGICFFFFCVGKIAHPLTCIQALWLKAKLIAWVMSVTKLSKVVSDHLVINTRY